MSRCVRCGMEAHEYGADGLPYCQTCLFYGMNRQCKRCGMYLPKLEMQLYKGQWFCQYCVMDLKEEERKRNEYKAERRKSTKVEYVQKERMVRKSCDVCGREIKDIYYIYNNQTLCEICYQNKKGDSPDGSPHTSPIIVQKKERSISGSIVDSILDFIKRILGMKIEAKKDTPEIVEVKKRKKRKKDKVDEFKKFKAEHGE